MVDTFEVNFNALESIRTLSVPSGVNLICPSEPVSIVCTCVLPVIILVASIPVKLPPSPTNDVAVTTPTTLAPPARTLIPFLAVISPTASTLVTSS